MRSIFKLCGIAAIFLSFSLLGVLKAYSKKAYISRLKRIKSALFKTDDMLCGGADNRARILKTAFGGIEGFYISDNGISLADKAVKGEARDWLCGFLGEFGSGDLALERQRIKRVCDKLSSLIENEEKDYAAYAKIWQTAGVCAGLGASIMLI